MADTITFTELGLDSVGPVKQTGPKSFTVGSLPQSDITNLTTDLAGKQPLNATLTGMSSLPSTPGVVVQTSEDVFTTRTFADSSSIVWTESDGSTGNFSAEVANSGITPGTTLGTPAGTFILSFLPDGRLSFQEAVVILIAISQVLGLQANLDTLEAEIEDVDARKLEKTANLSDVSNTTTARNNLNAASQATTISAGGLLTGGGDLSTNRTITLAASSVLQPSNNLSDLTNVVTARANLGVPSLFVNSRTISSDTTLTASDNSSVIYCNSDSNINITLPQQTTTALSSGFNCRIINRGLGDVRLAKEGFDILIQANNVVGQGDESDIYLVTAGTPNTWQMNAGTPAFPISYSWFLPTGSNASFIICGIIPAYTVFNQAYFKTNSGTITGVLTINGTSITGTMTMSSTENYASLTSPNIATPGSKLGITTSANSAATFAHVTVTGYQRYYLS